MSKLILHNIEFPSNTSLLIEKNNLIVKGVYGQEKIEIEDINIFHISSNCLKILPSTFENKKYNKFIGTLYSTIKNAIIGVSNLHKKKLLIDGIGYKFGLTTPILKVFAGYNSPISINIPDYITLNLENANTLLITGVNKEKVGAFAAKVKGIRKKNVYTGYGIAYENEQYKRKIGKKIK